MTSNTNPKASYSLKDTLDLNEYIIIKDGIENVKMSSVEKAFKPAGNPHLVNFILGSSVVS